uniref:Neur_chan_LBD domain-containing protein n=1 Tax=Panagrellus redivivus TaxID=6233 RepID=A0A7E5A0C3_PANRE
MRLLIVALALVGLAAVTNAGPMGRPALAEAYPFELYHISPRENRNLSNYGAVSIILYLDTYLNGYVMLKYVNDIKVSGKVPDDANATIDVLMSPWKNIVERAYSFNYETTYSAI